MSDLTLPIHPELLRRYREAWTVWLANPRLEEACRVIGMTESEWAERFVAQCGPITVTASGTSPVWSFDGRDAWACAKRPRLVMPQDA